MMSPNNMKKGIRICQGSTICIGSRLKGLSMFYYLSCSVSVFDYEEYEQDEQDTE